MWTWNLSVAKRCECNQRFLLFHHHCEPVQKKIKVLDVRKIKEIQAFRLKRSLLCEVMYSQEMKLLNIGKCP